MRLRALALIAFLLASPGLVWGQDGERAPEAAPEKVQLFVSSEPREASVFLRYTGSEGARETFVGTTPKEGGPLELDLTQEGPAEVVVFKDGFVCKVQTLQLRSGGSSRLEVRLAKDVVIPGSLTLKDSPSFLKDAKEFDDLYMAVLFNTVRFFVQEKDPRELVESSVETLVEILNAVRDRETVLRRELPPEARQRYYGDELDLRGYPSLRFSRADEGEGQRRYTLAAGGLAVTGTTDEEDLDSYLLMLHRVYAFLKQRWDARKLLSDAVLARCAIEGLLDALDDEHTHFMTPSERERMDTDTAGSFGGVGIVVALRGGKLTVIAPIAGTPAQKAGVLAGDVIVAVDGRSVERLSMGEAVRLMRGEIGTEVTLSLRRGAEELDLRMERAQVKIQTTAHAMLPGDVGYLRITSFMHEKLSEEVEKAVIALQARGAKKLIIDVRNNPGGLLTQAHAIADLFVKSGVIVSTRTRLEEESRRLVADPESTKYDLPLVVLINKGSASASEILAGTLQEHARAKVVGEKSFGKGSVQRVLDLAPYGCALALTVATYHLPSGATPHKRGVAPDVDVVLTRKQAELLASRSNYAEDDGLSEDPQIQAALKLLE